ATANSQIHSLTLHDALPISSPPTPSRRCGGSPTPVAGRPRPQAISRGGPDDTGDTARTPLGRAAGRPDDHVRPADRLRGGRPRRDRKSTRLNSSHVKISYAV